MSRPTHRIHLICLLASQIILAQVSLAAVVHIACQLPAVETSCLLAGEREGRDIVKIMSGSRISPGSFLCCFSRTPYGASCTYQKFFKHRKISSQLSRPEAMNNQLLSLSINNFTPCVEKYKFLSRKRLERNDWLPSSTSVLCS
eukprot:scaffold23743_cov33-Prasinocladus_malaysianus.AAC.1